MGSWEDIKQEEIMRSGQVFGEIEIIYSRKWYMGKGGIFRKCKRVGKLVWEKIRSRSKTTREDRQNMKDKGKSKYERV